MRTLTTIAASLSLVLVAASVAPAQRPAEAEVLSVVRQFFDALAAHDGDAIRAISLPEGRVYAMDAGLDPAQPRSRDLATDAEGIAANENDLLERMWNPTVFVHGPIAAVWTRYDFHVDGEFSHCGVDHFSLLETPDGWKIAAISYTVERENCPPSPLGEPQ